MDEQYLIQEARKGDLEAFNRLVLAHQDRLYHQAYRMLGDKDQAADVTQDAFIAAYQHLKDLRGSSLLAWLLKIVTNRCYDELRRQQRRPTSPLEPQNEDDEEIESPIWLIDPHETPEAQLERSELNHAIQHCLARLSIDYRTTLILVDIQGLDYTEAAEVLGCALGTIKSRLARARLNIQQCLQSFAELLPSIFRLNKEGIT